MIEVVPFKPEHINRLADMGGMGDLGDLAEMARDQCNYGDSTAAFTALDGVRLVGMAGFQTLWAGSAEAWFIPGEVRRRDWPRLTDLICAGIATAHGRHDLWRLQISVVAGWPAAHRWAQRLGFRIEGEPMEGFGPDGRNYWRYVHIDRDRLRRARAAMREVA